MCICVYVCVCAVLTFWSGMVGLGMYSVQYLVQSSSVDQSELHCINFSRRYAAELCVSRNHGT